LEDERIGMRFLVTFSEYACTNLEDRRIGTDECMFFLHIYFVGKELQLKKNSIKVYVFDY